MADFLGFDEGNVSYIPYAKDEKDDIQPSASDCDLLAITSLRGDSYHNWQKKEH